jgi:hypothetical protein
MELMQFTRPAPAAATGATAGAAGTGRRHIRGINAASTDGEGHRIGERYGISVKAV